MNVMKKTAYLGMVISAVALSGCLGGGGGSSSDIPEPVAETPTPQQQRIADGFFVVNEAQLPFDAIAADPAVPAYTNTKRLWGTNEGAGYRIEVPENWNGTLVMWTHGFRGEGSALTVDSPPAGLRKWLIDNNFAWAASSYSANYYDVRAGVEDTNALALAFPTLASEATPTKYLITGVSMGGHVAGAAVELETLQTANNVVNYAGAAPLCGVMGDTELFDYFTAYGLALYELAGVGADSFPVSPTDAQAKVAAARANLWTPALGAPVAPGATAAYINYLNQLRFDLNEDGDKLYEVLKNLSGGERPIYSSPYAFGQFQDLLQGFAGADGTIDGVLNESVVDTADITYRFATPLTTNLTAEEVNFNNTIVQAMATAGANERRDDGLRLIPKINGQFSVPVITAHTLGDLFVPFSMQQIYKERAEANNNDDLLVQRAIRAPGHCEFSQEEYVNTFSALVDWVENGNKPAGDVIDDPAVVAASDFGCTFTVGQSSGFRGFVNQPCPTAP